MTSAPDIAVPPPASGRRRFTSSYEWHTFIGELSKQNATFNPYMLRQACYQDLENFRKRPLFVFAADMEGIGSNSPLTGIQLHDVDGFIDMVDSVPEGDAVDVLLHSAGGSPEATERIVRILRRRFKHVTFLVPHSAYSAATMLALSGNEIILHPDATLGPIDPQIGGIPARSIRRGFEKVRELLKAEGPEALPVYIPLIDKHSIELLEICEDSLLLSKELVDGWLREFMFAGDPDASPVIAAAVEFFSSYDQHKTHARPLTFDKVQGLGLKIAAAEGDLKDLLREAIVLLNGSFGATAFVKLYENARGMSWGRQIIGPHPTDNPS